MMFSRLKSIRIGSELVLLVSTGPFNVKGAARVWGVKCVRGPDGFVFRGCFTLHCFASGLLKCQKNSSWCISVVLDVLAYQWYISIVLKTCYQKPSEWSNSPDHRRIGRRNDWKGVLVTKEVSRKAPVFLNTVHRQSVGQRFLEIEFNLFLRV